MKSKEILQFIRSQADRPMKIKELGKALNIPETEYPQFRRTVKALIDSADLVELKRGRIGVADDLNVLVGTISINRKGIGFLQREGEEEDILIPQSDLGTALDGDKVMVRRKGKRFEREAGTVIKVVERKARNIVGVFRTSRAFAFVKPDNPKIHREIYVPLDQTQGAKDGQKVVVVLTVWDEPGINPEGKITEVLGYPGQPGVDLLAIIKEFQLPEQFPAEVIDEAETAAARLSEEEMLGRVDLTAECIYTIDPVDAKDHDDAISIERTDIGYKLGVHIADVSHFVETGGALDSEAFQRGNSVYLPGMVIPMLPESLSNDVCSLKVNRKRLAHSAFIDFDKSGKMLSWQFADTVIKSKAKLSYEDVQAFFDGKEVPARVTKVTKSLTLARELAQILSKRRFAEGSLDFDLPEAKIVMNERGEVTELGHKIRLESHRLIEEFMLVTNQAVALELFRNGRECLYRVHDKPDFDKLTEFSEMMTRLGHSFPVSKTMKPVQFTRFLDSIKGTPEADFINEILLRSMKKAVYQRQNIGHFGLAFSHYAHFTSPIRRYPDLLVHRLLRAFRDGKYRAAFAKKIPTVIDTVGAHCSETERVAEAAERQAVKVKQVSFMAQHVGETYGGIISGVASYGFFVRLDNLGVEGLVRMSSIDDDYYHYDEKNYRIVGRRHGRVFRLGDPVAVGVLSVDTIAGQVDLFVNEARTKPSGKRGQNLDRMRKKQKNHKKQKRKAGKRK